MNTITQDMKFRQALIQYSFKYGVTKTAIRYKTNRQYVYRWRKRYDGTMQSLADKSHRPYHHPNQHTPEELKLISDMRKRNMNAGLVVFWVKLRQRGYSRSITGLYRVLRRTGEIAIKPPNPKYIPKPYEQMLYPSQRVQFDVKLVSLSHTEYFRKVPRVPKSELERYRNGLLIGSGCECGELYSSITKGKTFDECCEIARFYDYIEIVPIKNFKYFIEQGYADTEDDLKSINEFIIKIADHVSRPAVAVGDVHFLYSDDGECRKILMHNKGYYDYENQPELILKSAEEMFENFSYLGLDKAYEIVVENSNYIADLMDNTFEPFPKEMNCPKMDDSDERITMLSYIEARRKYGEYIPSFVEERLNWELEKIKENGHADLYLIAAELVKPSKRKGYVVGNRGCISSSLVAYFLEITEINPVAPHYYCEKCGHYEINDNTFCGCDLEDKLCPKCGEMLTKDGFNIPAETFMGADGEKEPDIDFNFAPEIRDEIESKLKELFGEKNIVRAGTISYISEKVASRYVQEYCNEKGIVYSDARKDEYIRKLQNVKRTTGMHPGGYYIIPQGMEISDYTPIQYPANNIGMDVVYMQRDLVREYVHKVGDTIIDEFLEDNISGTLYDRPGIKRMYELADAKMIDTVYIKDLSRLSRDRFYTLLIVKDMKERNVRIVSVTEGIVINVPMGYLKDRYTKKVEICEETADIIRRIYKLFLDGHGTETIAKILNQEGVKTPAYYELKLKGKSLGDNKPKATFEYLWTYSIVRRILTNPFYCGDLVNHQRERSRITKKQIKVPKEEQFIHKDAVPAIIPREIWDKVQEIIRINSEGKVKSQSNQPCHRYASLLKCGDCGSTFTAKRRKTKDKLDRIEYVCNGYHRHTHMVCSSHRINESVLDEQIYKQLAIMRDGLSKCSRQIESDIRSWMAQKNNVSKRIKRLQDSINATELEVEQILMEKIKDRDNAERYERMIEKRNKEIEGFKNEIAKIENIDKTIKERKKAMLENASLLDKILSEKELSHTNLCLLLEKIIIHEDEYGLRFEIRMKAPFLEKSYADEIGMIYEDDYEEVSA